jgi:uncharacterized membrane protein YgaE (UPF0421/DUF939 family)
LSYARLQQTVREHPRIALAAKAALATAGAWALVQPLGGPADDYPYYAPLGAMIAVGTTVAGSVRESLQSLLAIVLGAGLALVIGMAGAPEIAGVGIVVAVGTLMGGWWRTGSKSDWVPLTALFVLIIGNPDPIDYAIAYLGLTTLGAAVGIGVDLAFPPLPLTPTQSSVARLRSRLAEQLDELADGLLQETPPDHDGWHSRRREIRPLTLEMHDMVRQATEAMRANWRAGRWRHEADRQYRQAKALEQLAFLVEQMTLFLTAREQAEREEVPLGPDLRPYAAHAFQETAETLRFADAPVVEQEGLRDMQAAVTRLAEEVRAVRDRTGGDLFGAGSVVLTLRRVIDSISPEDTPDAAPPQRRAGSSDGVRRSQVASRPVAATSSSASRTTAGHAPTVQARPARLPNTEDPR